MTITTCARSHNVFQVCAVKEPLVNESAICKAVLTKRIHKPGSVLNLSDNQSRSTRCVPAICLKAGLRSLMVMFTTASLSSKTTHCAAPKDILKLGGTKSMSCKISYMSLDLFSIGLLFGCLIMSSEKQRRPRPKTITWEGLQVSQKHPMK